MKHTIAVLFTVLSVAVFAGPAPKTDPVAGDFPAWSGVNDKHHVLGRYISASDLRHKTTVVVVIEAANARDQLLATGELSALAGIGGDGAAMDWERGELPRDVIVVYSIVGGGDVKSLAEAAKVEDKEKDAALVTLGKTKAPVYKDVTFPTAPDAEGKYPFVYIMGHDGLDPLYKEPFAADSRIAIGQTVAQSKAKLASLSFKWRKFYGYLTEAPKTVKTLEKSLSGMKPLSPVQKEAKKAIIAKDAVVQREGQMIYDAIEQAKSDLLLRIQLEATLCPYRAAYDLDRLLKYWPAERKRVADIAFKLKGNPEVVILAKAFARLMHLKDPNFEPKPADVKKLVPELTKLKKQLEPLKASKNQKIQQGANIMETELDSAISRLQTKPEL